METEHEHDHHPLVVSSSAPTTVTTVAPFHYLISEQAKSIAALQELQNEVTALLEFRDLVMDTFPHLRTKSESSTPVARTGKRDWEPGVRVRRKLRDPETSLVPATRSRSNSHGKASKSEAGNSGSSTGSSAVQDSGFCTESKEHCSSSTTTDNRSRKPDQDQEAEDELWTLLDLIHRKGTKLRLEVEHLQEKYDKSDEFREERRAKSLQDLREGREPPRTKCDEVEVEGLRREREMLIDRVTEMEAENLANLSQTNQLLAEIGVLSAEKRDLEEQLRLAINTKTELNSRIHDLHSQFISRSESRVGKNVITPVVKFSKITPKLGSSQFVAAGSLFSPVKRSLSNEETVSSADDSPVSREFQRLKPREEHPNRLTRTSKELTVLKSAEFSDSEDGFKIDDSPKFSIPKTDKGFVVTPRFLCSGSSNPVFERLNVSESKCDHVHGKLGTLDGVISSPSNTIKGAKGIVPDRCKTAAILKETNVVELQRHLLTTTFENQVVRHKLRNLSTSSKDLSLQLERTKEENEDLKFQLEEKSIELEGTRARVRLLERLQAAKLCGELTATEHLTHSHTLPPPSHESTPTPLLPRLTLPLTHTLPDHSSTESAHNDEAKESPRKRPPSKIPLKSYNAPKPPPSKGTVKSVNAVNKNFIKDSTPSWSKKEKSWDPVTRSMKEASVGKRDSPRPTSRESVNTPSSVNRRIRKTSNQDGSFSSTNSTPSMRRDPPSSPAPKKIPQRDRIISDNDSKIRSSRHHMSEYPDSLNNEESERKCGSQELDRSLPSRIWKNSSSETEYFDSIDNQSSNYQSVRGEALAECDSLDPPSELGDLV